MNRTSMNCFPCYRPRFSRGFIHAVGAAQCLSSVLYSVGELAIELDVPVRTLRDWLNASRLAMRDSHGRLWVNGTAFTLWLTQALPQPASNPNPQKQRDVSQPVRGRTMSELIGWHLRTPQPADAPTVAAGFHPDSWESC